jgi:hypothetical protein
MLRLCCRNGKVVVACAANQRPLSFNPHNNAPLQESKRDRGRAQCLTRRQPFPID